MKNNKEQRDQIQQQDQRILQPPFKRGICLRSERERANLQQKNHHEPRDEYTADLPQNEFQVRPSGQPPPGGDTGAVPAWVVLGVSGGLPRLGHLAPRGRRKDLNRSTVAVSLYC